MKNLISRIAFGGILAAASMFAAQIGDLKVTLPHSVTVGSTTLPSGTYTISAVEMAAGDEYFVVRGEKTTPVVLPAMKAENDTTAEKTAITFAHDGDTWRFEKISIAGESTSYEFGR
jgi:hypothetical protein